MAARYPHDRFLTTKISEDGFWGKWRTAARTVTLPVQLKLLQDTGRYDAFNLKDHPYYRTPYTVWPVPDWLFWESDVAKWIEGVCYFLHEHPDEDLSAHVEHLVALIEAAQQPDGYLNIHFVVNEPEKRWSNLRDLHELYNGGHLIEAALAHHQLTGSSRFVDVMLRFVKHCSTVFGPAAEGKRPGYPGHPEVELALLRLYKRTGDQTSYDLARFFLTERGRDGGKYYVDEQAQRGEHPELAPAMMPKKHSFWYMQAQAPIAEQEEIEGHSVRAGYLLTAVADLVEMQREAGREQPETQGLLDATYRLWNSMVERKMYVTGGIGSVKQWEGFALPYSLPQSSDEGGCYAETCAAIAVVMVAERMLAMKLDGKVADVAERALFNASITSGMSVDGRSFTYENQLASSPQAPCERHTWFQCACCPPNVLRTLGVLGGFMWGGIPGGTRNDVALHQFFDGTIQAGDTSVEVSTRYPWSGDVRLRVKGPGRVLVRVPGWARDGCEFQPSAHVAPNGYAEVGEGETLMRMPLKPRLAHSHPYTTQDTVTLMYGPLVYCLEDEDNKWERNHFKDLCLQVDEAAVRVSEQNGLAVLHAPKAGFHRRIPQASRALPPGQDDTSAQAPTFIGMNDLDASVARLTYEEPDDAGLDLTFVPYYYRANRRTEGVQMRTSFAPKRR
ncbi:unnamed protein product [Parajaminaea phylloscopi]